MLIIHEPGVLNTIQDAGRLGYQALGVPVSGAMDAFALRQANALVRNAEAEAAIEMHTPIALTADLPCLLAITGAEARVERNGRMMPAWRSFFVRAGEVIEARPKTGGWAYLAVHGGIAVPRVLGSKSTCLSGGFGGLYGRALKAGDEIPIGEATMSDLVADAGRGASNAAIEWATRRSPVRVLPGPHQDRFTEEALATLTTTAYRVTELTDRMGYRLRGAVLTRKDAGELLSCGVPMGAIQVPPDGQPIVLMADHQTTGGYAIIATVITADTPIVAQCSSGAGLTFKIAQPRGRLESSRVQKDFPDWED